MAEIKNNENLTASLSSVENLNAEIQSKEEILKGKIASSILYFKGENGKSPYIGNNGNWFIYDDEKKEWIDTTVNAINGTVDLSEYYTKTETDDKIKEVSDWINEQINKFYTKEEIDKKFEDLDIGTGGDIDVSGKEDKINKVRQVDENDLDSLTEEQYLSAKASATLIRGLRNAIDEKSDLSKEELEELLSDSFKEIQDELDTKVDEKDIYSKETIDNKINTKANTVDVYNKEVIDNKFEETNTLLEKKENSSNKTIVLDSKSTDEQYPSAKAVYDAIAEKPSGTGDMLKSVYDKDNDGVVDKAKDAETLNGETATLIIASAIDEAAKMDAGIKSQLEDTNKEVNSIKYTANSVYDIAAGANRAKSFATYKDFVKRINEVPIIDPFIDLQNYPETYLPIGNNILIGTIDVPDLWVMGYSNENGFETYVQETDDLNIIIPQQLKENGCFYTKWLKIGQLETQKVDLTEYDTSLEVDNKISDLNNSFLNTFSAMQTDIINKANKATTLAGYEIEDAYTKDEVVGKLDELITHISSAYVSIGSLDSTLRDYYTKDEIDQASMQYARVSDLDGFYNKTEIDNKVGDIESALDSILALQSQY